ncbi:hypothetical protein ASC97_24760 [Rhizobium sp. Root1203]|nr:hypothetical protein ASC97_24760 [Rhizobium sp. Root1203]
MKIGVIGVGEIGGTLAARLSSKNHSIRVANSRGQEAVKSFADSIGAVAVDIYGAIEGADVVLLSMPFPSVGTLPKDLFGRAPASTIIIDTANYYPEVRDPRIPEIDVGMPESVWVSQQLGRPIFKAFNSIMFYALSELDKPEGALDRLAIPVAGDDAKGKQLVMRLAAGVTGWVPMGKAFNSIMFYALSELDKPEGALDRLAIPVAGDDAKGKQVVMGLVNETGFDPVDGGNLADSWRQQPSTPAYCCDYGAEMTRKGLEAAIKFKAENIRDGAWREKYVRLFANRPAYADVHPHVIALNRSLNPL